jgi:hypothetical protein
VAFKARYDGTAPCPKCKEEVSSGDYVQYADSERQVLEHVECTDVEGDRVIRWENVTEESLDRASLLELEEQRVAPLAPQGKCPRCHIELPKTRICGYC